MLLWFPGDLIMEQFSHKTVLGVDKEKNAFLLCVCVSCHEATLAGGSFGECFAFSERFGTC